jgi:transposase
VSIDYHIEIGRHYYSVPYQLVHKEVESRLTASTIEIFFKGRRVASHKRSQRVGAASTIHEHRPKSHQKHLEWTPSRIIAWAQRNGPHTANVVEEILARKTHPEQGYRSCLGIIRLAKKYPQRLEAACQRAVLCQAFSYQSVKSILRSGLDLKSAPDNERQVEPIEHKNIRGPQYYQGGGNGK